MKILTKDIVNIPLPEKKLSALLTDAPKAAAMIELVYVTGSEPGITRTRKNNRFYYYLNGRVIKNETELRRIKSLVIPPAWENVWICALHNGHLQATGTDIRQRKQYRYHPHWTTIRGLAKFYHLYEFAKRLPAIRRRVNRDLRLKGMPVQKVLAAVVKLMEYTGIRIGNNTYEKLYGSFGITTLKDKHVSFTKEKILFSFKGKKGVQHNISLKSKRLRKIVQQCRDIPGKELFQYYTEAGERKSIDSGMVNNYIREISGGDFTAKDFRTWAGTLHAFLVIKEMEAAANETACRKNLAVLYKKVSEELGNTPAVCKKYYIHPAIINLYEKNQQEKYLTEKSATRSTTGLNADESSLMYILKNAV